MMCHRVQMHGSDIVQVQLMDLWARNRRAWQSICKVGGEGQQGGEGRKRELAPTASFDCRCLWDHCMAVDVVCGVMMTAGG